MTPLEPLDLAAAASVFAAAVVVGAALAFVAVAVAATREVTMREAADEVGDTSEAVLEAAGRPATASFWAEPMHDAALPRPTVYAEPPTPPVPEVPASNDAMAKLVPRG
jgi:hypothetical protein